MCSPKLLASLIGSIYMLFAYFLFSGNLFYSKCASATIIPIITLAYFHCVTKRSIYFILFLIFFSISDLLMIVSHKLSPNVNYFLGNTLYILSYISLTIEIGRSLSFKYVFKHHFFSVIVLFILNAYIAYILLDITYPFLIFGYEYVFEIIYNISMLMILSLALLNYFQKDSRKAFYILVGAVCIVFAEVINIAYLYITREDLLNFLTISLQVIGFYFLYEQVKLKYKKQDKIA